MGQPWRHNQAGDLPGDGDAIDAAKLSALVNANRGKLGWTYTHKPVDAKHIANRRAIADANADGFVINLSADTLAEADTLAALNVGPVVVVLDAQEGTKADTTTPEGRKVITCPATYRERCDMRLAACCALARSGQPSSASLPMALTAKPQPLWRVAKHHAPSSLPLFPRRRTPLSPCRPPATIILYRKEKDRDKPCRHRSCHASECHGARAHGACRPRRRRLFRVVARNPPASQRAS